MKDSLSRFDPIDPAPAAKKTRRVTMYRVMYNGKASVKLYTKARANKIVKRATRMGADMYVVVFGKVSV